MILLSTFLVVTLAVWGKYCFSSKRIEHLAAALKSTSEGYKQIQTLSAS